MKTLKKVLLSRYTFGAVGLLLGIILTAVIMYLMAPGMMIHESESPYGFDKTVEAVEENAKSLGWKVPKVYDLQKSIKEGGEGDVGKIKIIELCKEEYAYGLLEDDDSKYVASMMPCAVGVYEKSDGKTYISSMNIGLMGKIFGGNVDKAMSKVATDDEIILQFANE